MKNNESDAPEYVLARYAHIIGWGMYVPETVLSNSDLSAILETDDEWIESRTGIKERRIASERQSTALLGLRAAQKALEVTNVLPSEIDLIIVATSTPENIFPSTASIIQHRLGASNAGAFDLSAACSGFVYGVDMAAQAIKSGSIDTAIVIGAETMTRVLDWKDRSTSVLFGDGAGAVVLRVKNKYGGVLSSVLRSDGSGHDLLGLPTIGYDAIRSPIGIGEPKLHKMYMVGGEVFRFATRVVNESIKEAVKKAGIELSDINLIVPHQANLRIIQSAARSLNLDTSLFMVNLERYGNTSAASIPIALCEALDQGRISEGNHIVLIGFGGGLSWGAVVIKWGIPTPESPPINMLRERQRRLGYAFIRIRTVWRNLSRRFMRVFSFLVKDDD